MEPGVCMPSLKAAMRIFLKKEIVQNTNILTKFEQVKDHCASHGFNDYCHVNQLAIWCKNGIT